MIVTQAFSDFKEYISELSDPRMDDYFMMATPIPTLALTVCYLVLVIYVLPAYMKTRPAFALKNTIFYYNLFQIIIVNSSIVYLSYGSGFIRRFSIIWCRELDLSFTDPDAIMALQGMYLFYLSKFPDFLDTVFFILRKKSRQVSFLHVFHHATMPLNVWLGTRVAPGGSTSLGSGTNGGVHVVMYLYYLLSGLGPRWTKYLWWKKYLTILQLIQFGYGIVFVAFMMLTPNEECPILMKRFPLVIYAFIYVMVLVFLFLKFYLQTYTKQINIKEQKNAQKIE